jgi:hypothetical protein
MAKTPASTAKAGGRYKIKGRVKSWRRPRRGCGIKTCVKNKGCPVR